MNGKPKTRAHANTGLEPNRPVLVAPEEQADHHRQTRAALQTAVAEDYVELIADLIDSTGEARATDIARRLGVTHASVTKTVARLQQGGLVTTQPYRAIFLTQEGRRIADASKRRRRKAPSYQRRRPLARRPRPRRGGRTGSACWPRGREWSFACARVFGFPLVTPPL